MKLELGGFVSSADPPCQLVNKLLSVHTPESGVVGRKLTKTDCRPEKLPDSSTDQLPAFAAMFASVKYWLDQLDKLKDKGFPDKRASSMLSLSWESSITGSAFIAAF